MLRKIRESQQEEGFTLIELLVVVIIIGILAAIAIPVFLAQRERAWRSAAQSDIRNAAVALETFYTDTGTYAGDPNATPATGAFDPAFGFNPTATVTTAVTYDAVGGVAAQAYCMVASHNNHAEMWYLGSGGTLSSPQVGGGTIAAGCPNVTTTPVIP
jgi:type IV pilus assembly protein PilA